MNPIIRLPLWLRRIVHAHEIRDGSAQWTHVYDDRYGALSFLLSRNGANPIVRRLNGVGVFQRNAILVTAPML